MMSIFQTNRNTLICFVFLVIPLVLSGQEPNQISIVDALVRHEKEPQTVFVDIRDTKAFGDFHIPGSINLPLYLMKTKQFLKHKKCIIVHRGLITKATLKNVEGLRNHGFADIHILKGGIHAWQLKEGPLNGSHSDHPQTELITYEHFIEHSQHHCWKTIFIKDPSTEDPRMSVIEINQTFNQGQLQDLLGYINSLSNNEFVLVIGAKASLRSEVIQSMGYRNTQVFFLRKSENPLLSNSRMNMSLSKSSRTKRHASTRTSFGKSNRTTKKGCGCKK